MLAAKCPCIATALKSIRDAPQEHIVGSRHSDDIWHANATLDISVDICWVSVVAARLLQLILYRECASDKLQ